MRRNRRLSLIIESQVFEILNRTERRSGPRQAPDHPGFSRDLDVLFGSLDFGHGTPGFDIVVAPFPVTGILEKRGMPNPASPGFGSVKEGLGVSFADTYANT